MERERKILRQQPAAPDRHDEDDNIDGKPQWQPGTKQEIDDRPHAPSPVHPDDIPYDERRQEEWERRHRDPNTDQGPRGSTEVDYSFDQDKE